MSSTFLRPFLLCVLLSLPSAASANIIFADDFNDNTPSIDSPVPIGWQITNGGSVDILGECNSQVLNNVLPGNGCYVDLDGGTGVNGLLTKSLDLAVGHTYTAYFSLAGNQTNLFLDTVYVQFGTATATFEIQPFDDFTPFSLAFTPTTSGTYALAYLNSNLDDYGALLNNVLVDQVPAPLPLFGTATVFGFSRRLRQRVLRGRSRR